MKALRRTQTSKPEQSEPHARDVIEFNHLIIDNDAHRVLADQQQVNLTPKEYELLIYLAKTPNKVFDREQLLKEVWHYEFYGDLRTVDTHVKRLREKLNRVSEEAAHMIQTVLSVTNLRSIQMMNRLNSVVIKLWLTIIFIVTTVLILLSAALITFIQYYYTQQTENAIREDASRISHLVEKADNKSLAIQHSQELIDGTGGVIIMSNKNMSAEKSYNLIKKNVKRNTKQ